MTSKSPRLNHQDPSTFFQDELRLALNDISYGIKQYKLLPNSDDLGSSSITASAVVDLFEGRQVKIAICQGGYYVDDGTPERYYESIDVLLSTISPQFESRKAGQLAAALAGL
jgi:hypothetical protein